MYARVAIVAVVVALVFGPWPLFQPSDEQIADTFAGKRVVVCGASMGIGTEIAYDFARAGAHVLITYHAREALERAWL